MRKNNFIQHRFGAGFIGKVFTTSTFEQTQKLGEAFAKTLEGGDIVALYGELGSGKTIFVQGLAVGLGIKKRIISPTFVIIRCYEFQAQSSKFKAQNQNSKFKSLERFCHIDLYRTEAIGDIRSLGIEEIINNKNNVVVIEWAEKMGRLLPKERIDVKFEYLNENKRKILIGSNL